MNIYIAKHQKYTLILNRLMDIIICILFIDKKNKTRGVINKINIKILKIKIRRKCDKENFILVKMIYRIFAVLV